MNKGELIEAVARNTGESKALTEKMVNDYLNQLPWVTAEGKKTLQTSVDMTKKTRDDYKKAVDEGFSKLEQLLEEK